MSLLWASITRSTTVGGMASAGTAGSRWAARLSRLLSLFRTGPTDWMCIPLAPTAMCGIASGTAPGGIRGSRLGAVLVINLLSLAGVRDGLICL